MLGESAGIEAMRTILIFALLVSSAGCAATRAVLDRPDVLVIVSDDQGWRDIGYHGSVVKTPHLDRLAATGVRLERFYVFPTCSPTRAAFLTGRCPSRFGILKPIAGRSRQVLPPGTPTLAGLLSARGYRTHIAGKWHLGLRPEDGPRRHGFGSSYGYLHGQIDPHTHLYKNGDRSWHRDDRFIDEEGHATDLIARDAVRSIESAGPDDPFFLYVAFGSPHTPLAEEEKYRAPYAKTIADPNRQLLAASITHMDEAIGSILAALDRTGRRRRTLVVFFSDNGGPEKGGGGPGEYAGKFEPYTRLGDNSPLRGWKGELYEGGIRVPAIAHWPGVLGPRVLEEPTSVIDWLPTVAALCGAAEEVPREAEGKDLWPLLRGGETLGQRTLYWRTEREAAVLQGDWKLIEARRGEQRRHLFDLDSDPVERRDLLQGDAGARKSIVEDLEAVLKRESARDTLPAIEEEER